MFLSRRWRRQPRGPVEVDSRHPLFGRIAAVYLPSVGPFNLLTGDDRLTPRTNTPAARPYGDGVAWHDSAAESALILTSTAPKWGGPSGTADYWSLLWVGHSGQARVPDGGRIFGWRGAHLLVQFGPGGVSYNGWTTGAGQQGAGASSGWPTTPTPTVLSGWILPAGVFVAVNGRVAASSTSNSGFPYIGPESGSDGFAIGHPENLFSFSGGRTQLGVAFRGGVGGDAHLALHDNPWQLFRPRTIRAYSLGGALSGIPVLSLPGVQDITSTSARPKVTLTF